MKLFQVLILNLVVFGLFGCGTTSIKDADFCQKYDWEMRGEVVALKGASVRQFDKYVKRCNDMKTQEDKSAFQRGYYRGIKVYCTYDNGYQLGINSKQMKNICPYELSSEFEKGYIMGRRDLQTAKQEIDNIGDAQGVDSTISNSPSGR